MFFYIYQANFTFLSLPFVSSSVQLSWLLMVLYVFFTLFTNKKTIAKSNAITFKYWKRNVYVFLGLFAYSVFLLLIVGRGDGSNIFEEVIKYFMYGIPMFWIWARLFGNMDCFMKVLLLTGIIQTFFILYCLINPTFALILDATVNYNPTIDDFSRHTMAAMREDYAGGLGCITSSGLVKYTLTGLIPCVYFCVNKEGSFYLLLFLIMAFCAAMLARTGLLYDIILALFVLLKRFQGQSMGPVIIISVLAIIFLFVLFTSSEYSRFVDDRFFRYESLKEGGTQGFFESYFYGANAHYPPINSDTFWGVGVTSGTSANGYEVNVDGGPMRQYSAIGILGCLIFYFLVLFNQIKTIRIFKQRNDRHFLWLLLFCMIIGEWKEVTFMAFWPIPLFFFVSFLLERKEKQNTIQ